MRKLLPLWLVFAGTAAAQIVGMSVGSPVFGGVGLNGPPTAGGSYVGLRQNHQYGAQICVAGTPDTVETNRDNGAFTACVNMAAALPLSYPAGSITAASWTAGVATYTDAGHGLSSGALVTIAGASAAGYNIANVSVTVLSSSQFTAQIVSNPGTWTSGGTVVANDGITITWPATTGHTAGDPWTISVSGVVATGQSMQKGIGAVVQPVGVKLDDRVSCAVDFGMVGDGLSLTPTDNLVALQRCLNSGHTHVAIEPDINGLGNYYVSAGVTSPSTVTQIDMPGGVLLLAPSPITGCFVTVSDVTDGEIHLNVSKTDHTRDNSSPDTSSIGICFNGAYTSHLWARAQGFYIGAQGDASTYTFYGNEFDQPHLLNNFINLNLVGAAIGINSNQIKGGELRHDSPFYRMTTVTSDGAGNLTWNAGDDFSKYAVLGAIYNVISGAVVTQYTITSITDSTHIAVQTTTGVVPAAASGLTYYGPINGTRELVCSGDVNTNTVDGTLVEGGAVDQTVDPACILWTFKAARPEAAPLGRTANGAFNTFISPYLGIGTWQGYEQEGSLLLAPVAGFSMDMWLNGGNPFKLYSTYYPFATGNVDTSGNVTGTAGQSFLTAFSVAPPTGCQWSTLPSCYVHLNSVGTRYTVVSITDATHMKITPIPATAPLAAASVQGRISSVFGVTGAGNVTAAGNITATGNINGANVGTGCFMPGAANGFGIGSNACNTGQFRVTTQGASGFEFSTYNASNSISGLTTSAIDINSGSFVVGPIAGFLRLDMSGVSGSEFRAVNASNGLTGATFGQTVKTAALQASVSALFSFLAGTGTRVTATDASGNISAPYTVGTAASNLVQLTAAAKLPAVDGSLLTALPAVGSAGSCGSTTTTCAVTFDANGRETARANDTIASTTVTAGTGITVSGSPVAPGGAITITNAGVISLSGSGLSCTTGQHLQSIVVSVSTGAVTLTGTCN